MAWRVLLDSKCGTGWEADDRAGEAPELDFGAQIFSGTAMSKLDYHHQTVGRILVYLVEQGLSRVHLDQSNAMEIMTERQGDEEEVLDAFADCLHWMINEGLIRASKVQEFDGGYVFNNVQLTAAGIAVVRADPHDADIGSSIEERVKKAEGAPLESGMYAKIGEFVGSALAGFTKSIGT